MTSMKQKPSRKLEAAKLLSYKDIYERRRKETSPKEAKKQG